MASQTDKLHLLLTHPAALTMHSAAPWHPYLPVDAVTALLELGADPDLETTSGCTALHAAALNGHAAVVSQLVEHGEAQAGCTGSGISICAGEPVAWGFGCVGVFCPSDSRAS